MPHHVFQSLVNGFRRWLEAVLHNRFPAWKDLAKGMQYLAKSKELGLDVVSFNCMLHACARLSQATQAEGIFKSDLQCGDQLTVPGKGAKNIFRPRDEKIMSTASRQETFSHLSIQLTAVNVRTPPYPTGR